MYTAPATTVSVCDHTLVPAHPHDHSSLESIRLRVVSSAIEKSLSVFAEETSRTSRLTRSHASPSWLFRLQR